MVQPDLFMGPDGQIWMLDPRLHVDAFVDDFIVACVARYWQEAAQKRMGRGLEEGVFLSATKRRLQQMPPECSGRRALIEHAMAARLWSPVEAAAVGIVPTSECPFCQQLDTDMWHLVWGCRQHAFSTEGAVQRSQHLLQKASRQSLAAPAFWLRGVPCRTLLDFIPPPPSHEAVRVDGALAKDSTWTLPAFLRVGTDGTGGRHTSEPRLRRCAWAAVVMCPALTQIGSITGLVTGTRQTVPRAELLAVVRILEQLAARATDEPVALVIHLDCQYVHQRWQRAVRSPRHHGDLWERFWSLVDHWTGRVTIEWGYSHLGQEGIDTGKCTAEHTAANEAADAMASTREAEITHPPAIVTQLGELDEEVALVQDRLAAIAEQAIQKSANIFGQAPKTLKTDRKLALVRAFAETKHCFRFTRKNGPGSELVLNCQHCPREITAAALNPRALRTLCRRSNGQDSGGAAARVAHDEQWSAQLRRLLTRTHSSHRPAALADVLYCRVCGCFGATRVRSLRAPCRLAPTQTGRANLRNLQAGRAPKNAKAPAATRQRRADSGGREEELHLDSGSD